MTLLSAIFLLIIIMDPIGNVPVFLSILKNIPVERRRKIIIRELLIALFVLLFFLFIGRFILQSLQISESSLGIAGGIMLFLIAIKINVNRNTNEHGNKSGETWGDSHPKLLSPFRFQFCFRVEFRLI